MSKDTITAPELLNLINDRSVTIVHIMSRRAFVEYRIKGSIWIPYYEIEDHVFTQIDKNKTVVTYCKDESCMSSDIAAKILRDNGYNALAYRGGVKEWKSLGYPSEFG